MAEKAQGARGKAEGVRQQRPAALTRLKPAVRSEAADLAALQRAVAAPEQAAPAALLGLQRTAGNQAVNGIIARSGRPRLRLQAKLMVGPVGDHYEQEADRVAELVVAGPQPAAAPGPHALQRQEEEEVQTQRLQRQEDEEEVQTKSAIDNRHGFAAGPAIESRLAALKGSGAPLPTEVRAKMEPRFGADFSGVRLHTGGEAVQLNRALQARAFTHGRDIYLGEGSYSPGTSAGNRLLAHELTHVIQQRGSSGRIARWGDPPKLFAKKGPGTKHKRVTDEAFSQLDGKYKDWYSQSAREYLAVHSDSMDERAGFLMGSLVPGKAYGLAWKAWGSMARGARSLGRGLARGVRSIGRGVGRGIGWIGEKVGMDRIDKEVAEEIEAEETARTEEEEARHISGLKGWRKAGAKVGQGFKTVGRGMLHGAKVMGRGVRRGIGWVGEHVGMSRYEKELSEGKEERRSQQAEDKEAQKIAQSYDNLDSYWRSGSEAPNHGEAGKYKGDGAALDIKQVNEYVSNAIAAYTTGNPRQAVTILAYALHAAEDRGAHGDGKPGTGHDPRKATPPPPGAQTHYYNEDNPDDGFDCDREGANGDGFTFAVEQAKGVLQAFVLGIGAEKEDEEVPRSEALAKGGKLAGWEKPGRFKGKMRGIGRALGGKDIIRW